MKDNSELKCEGSYFDDPVTIKLPKWNVEPKELSEKGIQKIS